MPSTPCSRSVSTYWSSVVPPGDWVHSTEVYPRSVSIDSMAWANAGKTGFDSSGTTRPTSPAERVRSRSGRS